MQRRTFLRFSALTFTSLLGHAGCTDAGGDSGTDDTGGSSTGGSGSSTGGETGGREVTDAPERFPQSIASGDPRPESVILWTRVEDPEQPDADYDVEVELWELNGGGPGGGGADESGGEGPGPGPVAVVAVTAEAAFDHCVKVKVEGLTPGTPYGYRFIYLRDGMALGSRTGQTRTAPPTDADVPVRFAFVSCQDYIGRYYNAYAALAEQPLDFFVHLGDYIYETSGDPSFQGGGAPERAVEFDDAAGAIDLGDGAYQAARSLDNYRQMYRTVRADRALQSAHERMAMIAIWDDHEFTNDSWGINGTYSDGRAEEADAERKAAASQAWFEYMPVDYGEDFVYDASVAPPDDIRIYRDLEFGQHLHLVLTDLRSYRPDHLVPEDAYPGAIALDEAALGEVRPDTSEGVPYVDIDAFADGVYAELLRSVAEANDYDPARITGNISAPFINDTIETEGSGLPLIEDMELDALPRGLAFHQLGKNGYYGSIGSRYLVVSEPLRWYGQWRFDQSAGADQRLMGQAQEDWFLGLMQGSGHTWKVWGNEFCLAGLDVDLTSSSLPLAFRQRFSMSAEDWNGVPQYRAQIVDALAGVDNVVAITGDIHAFFAGTPFAWAGDSEGNRVVEFVTSSVSSSVYSSILVSQVQADPALSQVPGIEAFAQGITDLLTAGANPNLGFAEARMHGFTVVEVSGAELRVDVHMHPESIVSTNLYDSGSLANQFQLERFRVLPGSRDLYRDFEGAWMRWDPATRAWV